jgi:FixJ family two-component response regulator
MMDKPATVFVVDDDPSVLKGVQRLLRSAGFTAEVFASPQEFLERHDRDASGCVILDLAMPELDGLQIQQALTDLGSVLPIIFLTGHGDIPTSVHAMKRGAVDFLTKPVSDDELLSAVQSAIERCRASRQARYEVAGIERRFATLTPRERTVLAHLLAGKLNKQIAADLGTAEQTVKIHRARIMQKMETRTVAALVRLAERAGIKPASPVKS